MPKEWYVLRSKPHKEDFLTEQLLSRDVDVYYPQLRVKPVNPRSRKIRPYFPGYLFIHIDLQKNDPTIFNRIPGAANLLMIGGEFTAVPENIVFAIRSKVDRINTSGGHILDEIKSGDKIRIENGPFEGYEGIFDTTISGSERARVLIKMFQNRLLPVQLPRSFIKAKKDFPV
jgi:transcription antitermination factor NusG